MHGGGNEAQSHPPAASGLELPLEGSKPRLPDPEPGTPRQCAQDREHLASCPRALLNLRRRARTPSPPRSGTHGVEAQGTSRDAQPSIVSREREIDGIELAPGEGGGEVDGVERTETDRQRVR